MTKKYLFWIIITAIFGLGLGVIRLATNAIYTTAVANTHDQSDEIITLAQARVGQTGDVAKLIATGQKLLGKNEPGFAKLYFARASDLDLNLRDASYGWGYSVVKSRGGRLTDDDVGEILKAIDRTERVDPLYLPMLELKLSLAEARGDQPTVDATKKRIELIKKK